MRVKLDARAFAQKLDDNGNAKSEVWGRILAGDQDAIEWFGTQDCGYAKKFVKL